MINGTSAFTQKEHNKRHMHAHGDAAHVSTEQLCKLRARKSGKLSKQVLTDQFNPVVLIPKLQDYLKFFDAWPKNKD